MATRANFVDALSLVSIWNAFFRNIGIIKDETVVRPWHLCDGKSPLSQTAQISHNALFCNIHFQKHISVTKWCIMGYETGASWDLYNRSIPILERRHPHDIDYLRYIDSSLFWDAGINCEIYVENCHYDTQIIKSEFFFVRMMSWKRLWKRFWMMPTWKKLPWKLFAFK